MALACHGVWIFAQQVCAHDFLPSGGGAVDPGGTNLGLAGRAVDHRGMGACDGPGQTSRHSGHLKRLVSKTRWGSAVESWARNQTRAMWIVRDSAWSDEFFGVMRESRRRQRSQGPEAQAGFREYNVNGHVSGALCILCSAAGAGARWTCRARTSRDST